MADQTGQTQRVQQRSVWLTRHEVELLRTLRAEAYSYKWLADKFEISVHCVGRICRYERRATR